MSTNKHLVIGCGEVGSAIRSIFDCQAIDLDYSPPERKFEFLHICFPYGEDFVSQVSDFKYLFLQNNGVVIIHSTVPVGTTEKCGSECVNSPVRGVHPNLKEGIKTFVKFFGGPEAVRASVPFKEVGISTRVVPRSRETEAGKLWSTTQYAASIILSKYIHEYCEENNLDFDVVYKMFNETYNKGYWNLGMKHVIRPTLEHVEGKIGGHCLISNCKLLDSPVAREIIYKNNNL